jgi:hypothetical protein
MPIRYLLGVNELTEKEIYFFISKILLFFVEWFEP